MTYDAGRSCCAEYDRMTARIHELEAELEWLKLIYPEHWNMLITTQRAEQAEAERDAMQAVAFQAQEMAKEQMARCDAIEAATIERVFRAIKHIDRNPSIDDAIRALAKAPKLPPATSPPQPTLL